MTWLPLFSMAPSSWLGLSSFRKVRSALYTRIKSLSWQRVKTESSQAYFAQTWLTPSAGQRARLVFLEAVVGALLFYHQPQVSVEKGESVRTPNNSRITQHSGGWRAERVQIENSSAPQHMKIGLNGGRTTIWDSRV